MKKNKFKLFSTVFILGYSTLNLATECQYDESAEYHSLTTLGTKRLSSEWSHDSLTYKTVTHKEYAILSSDHKKIVLLEGGDYEVTYKCDHSNYSGPYPKYVVTAAIKSPASTTEVGLEAYDFYNLGGTSHTFNLREILPNTEFRFIIGPHWDHWVNLNTIKITLFPKYLRRRLDVLEGYILLSDEGKYLEAFQMLQKLPERFPRKVEYIGALREKIRIKLSKLAGESIYERSPSKLIEARRLAHSFPEEVERELNSYINESVTKAQEILERLAPDITARLAALRSISDQLFE